MLADDYIEEAAEKMAADGSTVTRIVLPLGPAVVGYQARFRLRWFAARLHVFTVVVLIRIAGAGSKYSGPIMVRATKRRR